jgi:hypothetical protein
MAGEASTLQATASPSSLTAINSLASRVTHLYAVLAQQPIVE